MKRRVLSGIQPTGQLHIGNYLGAMKQWILLQELHECFFCVVDLHAITNDYNPKNILNDTLQSAAVYLAAGIDPSKSKIFIQSHVKAHAELSWLLNCITPINWLEKMIQFKEKTKNQNDNATLGLFSYPVLMASDILLYQTDFVPVGEDQRQHLELTRDICRKFNNQFCAGNVKKVFKSPKALIIESGEGRIMSLDDGRKKMSKSALNENSRINLLDSPDVIAQKIKRCKTDSIRHIDFDINRPECINLLNIYQSISNHTKEQIQIEVDGMLWSTFKLKLTDCVIDHLTPIRANYKSIINDPSYIESVLLAGNKDAEEIAEVTLKNTKDAMGLYQLNN